MRPPSHVQATYMGGPKSSAKRIATKKARESLPPGLSFSVRRLKIHALTAKKDHNLLI